MIVGMSARVETFQTRTLQLINSQTDDADVLCWMYAAEDIFEYRLAVWTELRRRLDDDS